MSKSRVPCKHQNNYFDTIAPHQAKKVIVIYHHALYYTEPATIRFHNGLKQPDLSTSTGGLSSTTRGGRTSSGFIATSGIVVVQIVRLIQIKWNFVGQAFAQNVLARNNWANY
jgi:hypothetical protein